MSYFGQRLCLFVFFIFSLLLFHLIFMYMVPFILMNMISLTICMIILVAVADVRHRMHLLHLPNIQVHKINTNSNSQGVIDPSRYFYFYYNNDSNNPIAYSIYTIIKLLKTFFSNQPL